MSCTGCEVIRTAATECAMLYLMAPLAHTVSKVRAALKGRFPVETDVIDNVLRVSLPHNSPQPVLRLIAGTLSNPELRDCRAVLLREGETFGLQHIGAIQTLHKRVAQNESGWLHDLLQQGGMHSIFQPIVHAAQS